MAKIDGLIVKEKLERAPDFVLGGVSFKVKEFIQFLHDNNKNNWVNLKMLRSREGKIYFDLDTWEPGQSTRSAQTTNNPPVSYTNDDLDSTPPF